MSASASCRGTRQLSRVANSTAPAPDQLPGLDVALPCDLRQTATLLCLHVLIWKMMMTIPACPGLVCVCAQLCLTLCESVDYSRLGSSIHGILQARMLKWVAIFFSRGIFLTQGSNPSSCVSCTGRQILYHCPYLGSPGYYEDSMNLYVKHA